MIAFALFGWVGAVVAGFAAALIHEQTPAERHTVVASWPLDTVCQPPALKPMLVLFIHPKCPCLRASIEEIANLRKVCGVGFDLQCVFLQPDAATWHSEETANWRDAQTLAPCQMIVDCTGEEHRRFGATTSGEVFLFSAGGELQFHGGVTIGRGHSGQSAGRLAIEAIVNNSSPRLCEAPVYGCPLESPCQAAASCGRNEAKLQR
ncbi:MAG TPA: hypothetical protein VM510_08805 [Caulifigura sp.]|nr:hypothetical protein [Caulifigura sp.]